MSVIGSMQRQATGQISARNQAGANGISVRYLFPHPGAMVLQGLHYPGYVPMKSLGTSNANYSLCHGLAGNAEALFEGSQVLGQECADGSALAFKVANAGIEMYARHSRHWPCGAGGGETPSLMLGLAGIGYFYLRLYNATVPSILILRPSPQLQGDLEPAGK
ncbi:MAG: hypothetical protein E6I93_14365 [Chloroflexi bacterium]|nr:MAG: hypothetical protein E6I93_14365 [Chloroflexota bacterium]